MNPSGATTSSQIRSIYSPDATQTNHLHSPLNGGIMGMGGFPGDPLPPPPRGTSPTTLVKNRPNTLGSVIGVNPTINNNNNHANGGSNKPGKKTRWLLCYPSGGTASSESPSPPNEEAPVVQGSNTSTPSPTDGGFKIPNSQSNERPTSLPVALLNSLQRNGKNDLD